MFTTRIGWAYVTGPTFDSESKILFVCLPRQIKVTYLDINGIIFFNILAAMGGLLSLGLGLSFISVVELIYFVFLRCFLPYKQPKNLTFSHHNANGLEMANESNDIVMTYRSNNSSKVRSGGKSSDNLVIESFESNNGLKQ